MCVFDNGPLVGIDIMTFLVFEVLAGTIINGVSKIGRIAEDMNYC